MKNPRADSIAHQLLNAGIGSVSASAAEAIAARVPPKPRRVPADVLNKAVRELIQEKVVRAVPVGEHIVLE
jgi:hypothetical protein